MTQHDFLEKGYNNRHCKFYFTDGQIEYGVITTFFPDEINQFYLVRSPQLIDFKKYENKKDYTKMKEVSILVNLDNILNAEILDPFHELLLNKKEQQKANVNWDDRKDTWLKSVDSFYAQITQWLSPFTKDGLINIQTKEINLNENFIGLYKTKQLDIYLGNDIIYLKPVGTLILGSFGRIDMKGPKGEVLLVEKDWNNWKFATRLPKLKYTDITEESFKNAITEIVNG